MIQAYVCPVCGYIFDKEEAGKHGAFAGLPDDWPCPVCGCAKKEFTIREPEKNVAPLGDETCYICLGCGYRYEVAKGDPERGVPPGTAFADLPKDWTCPKCRAPKTRFAKEG